MVLMPQEKMTVDKPYSILAHQSFANHSFFFLIENLKEVFW